MYSLQLITRLQYGDITLYYHEFNDINDCYAAYVMKDHLNCKHITTQVKDINAREKLCLVTTISKTTAFLMRQSIIIFIVLNDHANTIIKICYCSRRSVG